MVADTQVKTGGVDAASPMGTGLVMNVITKSGGNVFKGSGAFAYQPYPVERQQHRQLLRGATAAAARHRRHADHRLRAPVRRRARRPADARQGRGSSGRCAAALSSSGISRTSAEVARIAAFTGQRAVRQRLRELAAVRQGDEPVSATTTCRPSTSAIGCCSPATASTTTSRSRSQSTGGPLYSGKITSVWGSSVTTTFSASYNGKGGDDRTTFEKPGPQRPADHHPQPAPPSGATLQGNGRILEGGNLQSYACQPASMVVLRGDLTYFKDGWFGNHEFQTGFFLAPRNTYDQDTHYVNDGFVLEEHRLRDVNNIARRHGSVPPPLPAPGRPAHAPGRGPRLRALRPGLVAAAQPRLTVNLGVRADFVKRTDKVFDIVAPGQHGDRPALRLLVHADRRRPDHAPRQRRARARAGDGPRRDHAVRGQRGRRRQPTSTT